MTSHTSGHSVISLPEGQPFKTKCITLNGEIPTKCYTFTHSYHQELHMCKALQSLSRKQEFLAAICCTTVQLPPQRYIQTCTCIA